MQALNFLVFSNIQSSIFSSKSSMPSTSPAPDTRPCIGIITADSQSLGPKHFAGLGIIRPPRAVIGLQGAEEFPAVFLGSKTTFDPVKVQREMIQASRTLLQDYPQVGAVILECTNMPPYARAVQHDSGLPVFDVLTMIHYVYQVVSR